MIKVHTKDTGKRPKEETGTGRRRKMKTYKKHLIASASIMGVFILCLLAISISPVPASYQPAQASPNYEGASLSECFVGIAEAVAGASGNTEDTEEPAPVAAAIEVENSAAI